MIKNKGYCVMINKERFYMKKFGFSMMCMTIIVLMIIILISFVLSDITNASSGSTGGIGFTEPSIPVYRVIVENSFADNIINGTGLYESGASVTIRSGENPEWIFDHWQVIVPEILALSGIYDSETNFFMINDEKSPVPAVRSRDSRKFEPLKTL